MKDPAVLWYFNDWLAGTMLLSRHHKGCYIDLLLAQFNNGRLSIDQIKTVLGSDFGQSWPTIQKKFKYDEETSLYYNERLEIEQTKRRSFTESRRKSSLRTNEDQVKIYIVKDIDSGNVKIGSSVNPIRRFEELCHQKNPAITIGNRNYILVWYSDILPRTEEKVIHEKFSEKRITGEWFRLSDEEIESLTKLYGGTYVNRTLERTGDKNVNENRNKDTELPNWLNPKAWAAWEQHRKEKNKALTPTSKRLQLKLLEENKETHAQIIKNSITNGWTGLFPLKENGFRKPNKYVEPNYDKETNERRNLLVEQMKANQ